MHVTQSLSAFGALIAEGEDLHQLVGLVPLHLPGEVGELLLLRDLIDLQRAILHQDGAHAEVAMVEVGSLSIEHLLQLGGALGGAGDCAVVPARGGRGGERGRSGGSRG